MNEEAMRNEPNGTGWIAAKRLDNGFVKVTMGVTINGRMCEGCEVLMSPQFAINWAKEFKELIEHPLDQLIDDAVEVTADKP